MIGIRTSNISSTIVKHAYEMVSPDAILYPSIFEGWGERGVSAITTK